VTHGEEGCDTVVTQRSINRQQWALCLEAMNGDGGSVAGKLNEQ
jgi:hypothetical protein